MGLKNGEYIIAYGDEKEGYYPPSNVESPDEAYISTESFDKVKANIINYAKKYAIPNNLGWNSGTVTNWYDYIQYSECSVYGLSENSLNPKLKREAIFLTKTVEVAKKLKIEHTRMPVLLVSKATTWSRNISYNHTITQNAFKQNDKKYIIPKSVSSIGLKDFTTELEEGAEYGYRGKAYNYMFYQMKEKDVINILLQLEVAGIEGGSEAYEFMRDTYKLLKQSQEYSNTLDSKAPYKINPNTYKYLYIPDSVIYYDDNQTQKIYWLELLAANGVDDYITKEELANMRTKNPELTWQVLEYNEYDECNGKVYALNPFGSAYVRAYFQKAYDEGYSSAIDGAFSAGSHSGADWGGRSKVNEILQKGASALSTNKIASSIYNYEYERYVKVYGETKAKNKLDEVLNEEKVNMPIVAVAPGRVLSVGYSSRSGFYVSIQHSATAGNAVVTRYMHLKRWPLVNEGDYVGAGTYLGYEGNTGRSFGTHLHFQLEINGTPVDPTDYILPSFNPFYNEEKAKDADYNLSSDYMSLYRTIYLADSSSTGGVKNTVPAKALLESTDYLIQEQGKIVREIKNGGALDWTNEVTLNETKSVKSDVANYYENIFGYKISSAKDGRYDYLSYLYENDIFTRYNDDIFFDEEAARNAGLLDMPDELIWIIYGNIPVKTDMPGSLPALTRAELEYILENWLNARYGKSETKMNHLKEKVFTEETITAILEAQEKYKVSAVFMLAVAAKEQQVGTVHLDNPDYILSNEDICNIFSIKYSKNALNEGSVEYMGSTWNDYESYAQAFTDFSMLIGERGPYFKNGKYTIAGIGQSYCVPPEGWINGVTYLCMEILKYYTGSDWSTPIGPGIWYGDNQEVVKAAINCFAYCVKYDFNYCQNTGTTGIPPYGAGGTFDDKPEKGKHSGCTGKYGCIYNYPGMYYRIDCSTYVCWVLYEYAKANGITGMQTLFSDQQTSRTWKSWGDAMSKGDTKEVSKYMVIAWDYNKDEHVSFNELVKTGKITPGDILVEYDGDSGGTTHHVEIYIGKENDELDFRNEKNYKGWGCEKNNTANIYSCGLYKKKAPSEKQMGALRYVFRPLPADKINE